MESNSNQPTPPPVPNQPPAGPAPQYQQPMENPGQTLGIIGLVLNFVGIAIGGIILGAMSRSKSKEAGMSTALGTISLVWGIVATVLVILGFVLIFGIGILAAMSEPSYSY